MKRETYNATAATTEAYSSRHEGKRRRPDIRNVTVCSFWLNSKHNSIFTFESWSSSRSWIETWAVPLARKNSFKTDIFFLLRSSNSLQLNYQNNFMAHIFSPLFLLAGQKLEKYRARLSGQYFYCCCSLISANVAVSLIKKKRAESAAEWRNAL